MTCDPARLSWAHGSRPALACLLLGALAACGPGPPAAPATDDPQAAATEEPSVEPGSAAEVGRTLPGPDFELLGLDGERHRLSSFRGRVLLLNFWATWCLSCREELPALERLHRQFADQSVSIVGIATDDEGRSLVEPYVQDLGLTYPILLDPKKVSTSLFGGLAGYPSTFILDPQGLIYSSYLGAQEEAIFAEDLRYLLQAGRSEAARLPPGALGGDASPPHVPESSNGDATPPE
ncbi:MAG: TlpA disulfide reductase family protein [Acidobacteriota bacterium]